MKYFCFVIFALSVTLNAQFRDDPSRDVDIRSGITNSSPSSFLLGFINPQNFQMNHSVSMSYSSFGGQGVALGVYTNNMSFKFSDDLNIEADVSLVTSPYSSFGSAHSDQLNGIYLSRAQLNYRPSDNMFITIQYNGGPYNNYYSPYYNSFYSPFRRNGIRVK